MFDKITKIIGLIASLAIIFMFVCFIIGNDENYIGEDFHSLYQTYDDCNVGVVKLYGDLYSYIPYSDTDIDGYNLYDEVSSEQIIDGIQYFADNDNYKMIVLEVDSLGGSPYAAREIMNELKNTKKESVALIREYGDSAGYRASLGADKIIASELSELGSIGIIMSLLNEEEYNKINGYSYEDLTSGKFKNAGSPNKKLTDEEKELFMRDINIMYDIFTSDVASERGLDLDDVKRLADGSTMLGTQGLEKGLIDELGDLNSIKKYFKETYGEEAILCEY